MESEQNKVISLPIIKAAQKAEVYYRLLADVDDPDYETVLEELNTLVQDVIKNPIGDANDFHNFAVGLSKNDMEHLACDVIRCGLKIFPKNCDLLSDFLQYGMRCGLKDECNAYYETLQKLPKRLYTWRGFSFSIDYLENLLNDCDTDEEIDALEEKMISLANDYLKYLPYEEDSYRTLASIYEVLKKPDQEREVLENALKTLNSAPKCALRLADIMVKRGEYSDAIPIIYRSISDNNQDQPSVNEGYLYYLSGRAKLGNAEKSNAEFDEPLVLDIYSDFNVALATLKSKSYTDSIFEKVRLLSSKTNIKVPEMYVYLYDLVEG